MLVAACALALAACGGDDDDSDSDSTEAPEATVGGTGTPAATDAPSVEGVTFTPPEGDYTIVYPAEPTQNDQLSPCPTARPSR